MIDDELQQLETEREEAIASGDLSLAALIDDEIIQLQVKEYLDSTD